MMLGHMSTMQNSWNSLLKPFEGCEQCQKIDVLHRFHIDSGYDIVKKVCTDEVLREFENNTLGPVNIDIFDDEAGPSHAKISRKS